MSRKSGNIRLCDHTHAKMGTKNIGVVVKDYLLHLYSQFCSPVFVKGHGHFMCHVFYLIVMIMSVIICGTVQAVIGKKVFRILGRSRHHGADIDIPGAAVHPYPVMVRRIRNFHLESNLSQRRLRSFRQQRKFLPAWIGQPA